MFAIERQNAVLEHLRTHHSATVAELSRMFFISETSIRRDLARLEKAGHIRKTYGGAVLAEGNNTLLALEARENMLWDEKQIIGQKAISLIQDGDVVFLDSSSTTLAMAEFLGQFNKLTVITHSLKTASSLLAHPHLKVYMAGGLVAPNLHSCSGALTCGVFEHLYADVAFISPRAIDANGNVYCTAEEEASVRRTILEHAQRRVLLCNIRKLGKHAPFYLCRLNELHTAVCEGPLERQWIELFAREGIQHI